ncbi:hypothetical protein BH11PLA2_BH11PLA2_33290 [soil metagenome]
MRTLFTLLLISSVAGAADNKMVNFVFDDQFETKPDTLSQKGKVLVLVYGDNKAMNDCRALGEALHLAFHPTAKGLEAAKARKEPVAALPNLQKGQASPEVLVQAVACCGKMPNVVKPVFRDQLKKASPDVPVWLDYEQTMTTYFGMTTGQANVAVFDIEGRFRKVSNGTLDAKQQQSLVDVIQQLRIEAVKEVRN